MFPRVANKHGKDDGCVCVCAQTVNTAMYCKPSCRKGQRGDGLDKILPLGFLRRGSGRRGVHPPTDATVFR